MKRQKNGNVEYMFGDGALLCSLAGQCRKLRDRDEGSRGDLRIDGFSGPYASVLGTGDAPAVKFDDFAMSVGAGCFRAHFSARNVLSAQNYEAAEVEIIGSLETKPL